MKKQGGAIASVVLTLCLLLSLLSTGVFVSATEYSQDKWNFGDSDQDTWEYLEDGSLHHKIGNALGIEFVPEIDLTKSLLVEFDFAFDGDKIFAEWSEGEPRPMLAMYLRSQDMNPEQMLAIGIKGPGLWVENDNHWTVEPSFSDGVAWRKTYATPSAWTNGGEADPVVHTVVERIPGKNTINLKMTIGTAVITDANMYIRAMEDFMKLTSAKLCFKQDQVLQNMDVTVSNIVIVNDGVTLYNATDKTVPTGPTGNEAPGLSDDPQWSFEMNNSNTWEKMENGSLHHKVGNAAGAELLQDIDLNKGLRVDFDFTYNAEAIKAVTKDSNARPNLALYFRSQTMNPEQMLGIGILGPHLPTEGDSSWTVEPSFNDGTAWRKTYATPSEWTVADSANAIAHVTVERIPGENTINLKMTVGSKVVTDANMYLRAMDDFMKQTDIRLCFKQDQVLDTMDITISNLSVVNGDDTLVEGPPPANDPSVSTTVATTADPVVSTTAVDKTPATTAVQNGAENGNGSLWIWIVVAVMLVAAAGVVVVAMVIRRKQAEQPVEEAPESPVEVPTEEPPAEK